MHEFLYISDDLTFKNKIKVNLIKINILFNFYNIYLILIINYIFENLKKY
jgi:hypothetical protein